MVDNSQGLVSTSYAILGELRKKMTAVEPRSDGIENIVREFEKHVKVSDKASMDADAQRIQQKTANTAKDLLIMDLQAKLKKANIATSTAEAQLLKFKADMAELGTLHNEFKMKYTSQFERHAEATTKWREETFKLIHNEQSSHWEYLLEKEKEETRMCLARHQADMDAFYAEREGLKVRINDTEATLKVTKADLEKETALREATEEKFKKMTVSGVIM